MLDDYLVCSDRLTYVAPTAINLMLIIEYHQWCYTADTRMTSSGDVSMFNNYQL